MFFAGVNLPVLPWEGSQDLRLRIGSWVALALAGVTPWILRAFHKVTDVSILRASNVRAVQRALDDIDVNPTNPAPHVALADIYQRQGRLDEAIKQLEIALEKAPTMAAARARLEKLRARQSGLVRRRRPPAQEAPAEPAKHA
jgi:tetratricopeptide (TPR) repeat protein